MPGNEQAFHKEKAKSEASLDISLWKPLLLLKCKELIIKRDADQVHCLRHSQNFQVKSIKF